MAECDVRLMSPEDLEAAAALTRAAFGAFLGNPQAVAMPALTWQTRLASDPEGCFVAQDRDGRLIGSLVSVARGTLAWFGPLAVDPAAQRGGVARQLVSACLDAWRARGVRLMGLETFAHSAFHVHFYGSMGFRPAWTGVAWSRELDRTALPAGVGLDGALPDLGFLYPGLEIGREAGATPPPST